MIPLAQVTLNLQFGIQVTHPVEMPMQVITVSHQEVMMKSFSAAYSRQYLLALIAQKALEVYNQQVEHSPIMDMFADPDRYKPGSRMELELDPSLLPRSLY